MKELASAVTPIEIGGSLPQTAIVLRTKEMVAGAFVPNAPADRPEDDRAERTDPSVAPGFFPFSTAVPLGKDLLTGTQITGMIFPPVG